MMSVMYITIISLARKFCRYDTYMDHINFREETRLQGAKNVVLNPRAK
jgi:hypothetical protein